MSVCSFGVFVFFKTNYYCEPSSWSVAIAILNLLICVLINFDVIRDWAIITLLQSCFNLMLSLNLWYKYQYINISIIVLSIHSIF